MYADSSDFTVDINRASVIVRAFSLSQLDVCQLTSWQFFAPFFLFPPTNRTKRNTQVCFRFSCFGDYEMYLSTFAYTYKYTRSPLLCFVRLSFSSPVFSTNLFCYLKLTLQHVFRHTIMAKSLSLKQRTSAWI